MTLSPTSKLGYLSFNGPHYDLALYPRLHDIYEILYVLRVHKLKEQYGWLF